MVVVDLEEDEDPSEDDDGLEDGEGDGHDVEEDLDDGRLDEEVFLLHFVTQDQTQPFFRSNVYVYF